MKTQPLHQRGRSEVTIDQANTARGKRILDEETVVPVYPREKSSGQIVIIQLLENKFYTAKRQTAPNSLMAY